MPPERSPCPAPTTYTGATTVAAGTLRAGAANAFSANSATMVIGGATLDIGGFAQTVSSLAGAGVVTNSGGKAAVLTNQGASSTFAGIIQDGASAIGLTQNSAGNTLTLSGANTYTGATTVAAGTLRAGATNAFSANSATTVNALSFFDLGGFAQTINEVSLAGGTVQNGALTGAITSTGGTINGVFGTSSLTATSGVTTLIGTNAFSSIHNAANIINLGTVTDDLSNSGIYINSGIQFAAIASNTGTITNSGSIWSGDVKAGANVAGGLITNQGVWTGTGTNAGGTIDNQATWIGAILNTSGTFTNEGTVSAGVTNSGSASNSGSINGGVANSGTFDNLSGGSIAGGLTNSGGIFTNSSGATLDAANVTGGALINLGSISGAAIVGSGATLGGSGAVGSLSALAGSTVAPGIASPFSTMTVKGAASFASGSTLLATINAAGLNDRLNVGGALTINGGGVQIVAVPGTYSATASYTLVSAQGGVNGTFASLATSSNLAFLSPVLTYDANDVYLRFRAIATFASVAQTPNHLAVANALQPLGFASPLYSAVVTQTPAGAQQAFNALSGEIHASAMSAAIEDTRLPREAVLDRLASPYGVLSGGGSNPFMANANFGAKDLSQVWTTWGQAFGSSGHISGDGNAAYLNDSLAGFIFGADATIDGRYRLGIATSYTHSNLSDPQRNSGGRIDSTSIGVYDGTSQQALQLRAGGFYTFNRFNTTSAVVFPGFYGSDSSGYDGGILQAFGEAGWRIGLPAGYGSSSWFEPFAGLLGVKLNTNSFAETGSAAALIGSSGSFGYGASTLGVRTEFNVLASAPITIRTMLGWRYVFGALSPDSALAFASASASQFTVYGAPLTRNALAAELGTDWRISKTAVLGLYYSGVIGGGVNDNAVKGKFEVAF